MDDERADSMRSRRRDETRGIGCLGGIFLGVLIWMGLMWLLVKVLT